MWECFTLGNISLHIYGTIGKNIEWLVNLLHTYANKNPKPERNQNELALSITQTYSNVLQILVL